MNNLKVGDFVFLKGDKRHELFRIFKFFDGNNPLKVDVEIIPNQFYHYKTNREFIAFRSILTYVDNLEICESYNHQLKLDL